MKKLIILALTLLIISALGLGLILWNKHSQIELSAIPLGGDILLPSTDGEFNLAKSKKNYHLVYFGYTFCPDICPTTLSLVSSTLRKLSSSELSQLGVIFISVDPKRDDLTKLKNYVGFFHPQIIGATSNEKEIAKLAKKYGVAYQKHYPKKGDPYYSVDHSTQLFLVDRRGRMLEIIKHATPVLEMLKILRKYL